MKQRSLLNLAALRASTLAPLNRPRHRRVLFKPETLSEPLRQKMTVLLSLCLLRDKPWPTMRTSCSVDRDIYTTVPLCLSVCPSVRPFVSQPVCLSLCLSVRPLVTQFVCPSVCPSVPPSVSHPVCLFLCLSVRSSVCLSVCLVSQSVRLSVRLFVRLLVSQSVCFSICPSVRQSVCLSAIPCRVYNER